MWERRCAPLVVRQVKKTSSFFTQPERQTKIWRFFCLHFTFYDKNRLKHFPFFNFFGFSVHFLLFYLQHKKIVGIFATSNNKKTKNHKKMRFTEIYRGRQKDYIINNEHDFAEFLRNYEDQTIKIIGTVFDAIPIICRHFGWTFVDDVIETENYYLTWTGNISKKDGRPIRVEYDKVNDDYIIVKL